jgi:hypothetical protein
MNVPMAVITRALLESQDIAFRAASAERFLLQEPQFDTPRNRGEIADGYAISRTHASDFAALARLHHAANDA